MKKCDAELVGIKGYEVYQKQGAFEWERLNNQVDESQFEDEKTQTGLAREGWAG